MGKLADEHEGRYAALLGCIGGGKWNFLKATSPSTSATLCKIC
jgi:hypothetical protein